MIDTPATQSSNGPTTAEVPHVSGAEKRRCPRKPSFVVLRIAAFDGKQIPDAADFFDVEAHDISSGGFACLMQRRPTFDQLVVELGSPPNITYRVAEVAHCTDVWVYPSGLVKPIAGEGVDPPEGSSPDEEPWPMVLVGNRFVRSL